ncbi:MAG: DUF2007 domain-containing protein [Saprospiraceae bacterium]|nr:DUF2007 domain-containing protein [Saprospiraceae bacterium]
MSQGNFVTIRSYHDHIIAEIIIAALHAAGIETFRLDESHTMLPTENVEIKVLESDVDAALEIIEKEEGF